MNSDASHAPKRILPWVLGIALGLLFLTTLATGGALWWWRQSSSARNRPAAPQAPTPAANWSPANFNARKPDSVRATSDKSWSVKGGNAFMNVTRKADNSLDLRFVYPFEGFLPPETVNMVRLRWRSGDIAKAAPELNITEDQIARLKAVSPATDIPVSNADKQRLRKLFEDYLSAKDAPTEEALIAAVAELDATYREQTRERIETIAQGVKGIFDADQLAALNQRFTPRPR